MEKKIRLNIYISPENLEKVSKMAERLGMTKTGVASIAIAAGLDALSMAFDPDMKAYFEAMMKKEPYVKD